MLVVVPELGVAEGDEILVVEVPDEPDVDVELGGSVAGGVVQAPRSDTVPRARAAA